MDVNLTGLIATNTTLIQPWYNGPIIGAAGLIVGAAVAGGLTLLRDILNRREDRNDERNRLIGQLKGQKGLVLQYYAFYFFSFIDRGYLTCRSIIQAMYAIDYKPIYSLPESERNKEIMRIADDAREESIEYKVCLKRDEELNKWKEELAKGNKQLWTIIGSLQNYYFGNSTFDELDTLSKQIEKAMDDYGLLERTIMDEFNSINQNTQKIAGGIPREAYEEERKIDVTLDDRWATFGDRVIENLLPSINKLQHSYYLSNIKLAEDTLNKIRNEHESVSKNLNDKIDALINQCQKRKNKKWWQFGRE